MCGRFTLRTGATTLIEKFGGLLLFELPLQYNISPTQMVATVRIGPEDAVRRWEMVRWGLIPSWAKEPSIGNRMINARAETVADKPAFRAAFRRRRCLVPADGYFEWQKTRKSKQPYYIRRRDDLPFAMAGLWERWTDPQTDEPIETCTIITTEANELTRPIHDRMPVILDAAGYDRWLDPHLERPDPLRELLRPFAAQAMRADPVDAYVNNPRNGGPQCIQPLPPETWHQNNANCRWLL
ncbi:MAG: SOS response-associated peptidase [Candidatus Anammoximicrobium sp.]|nr:SOS response-associated peptidase [Candidatus Anammoximicrobium sp.]